MSKSIEIMDGFVFIGGAMPQIKHWRDGMDSKERARVFDIELGDNFISIAGMSKQGRAGLREKLAAEFDAVRQQGIEAGIEAAAELFVDGRNGHWHLGEISKLIRALDPAAIAAKVAERPTASEKEPR